MRSLGIVIKKNEIFYSLVEGSCACDSKVITAGKEIFNPDSLSLMMDFQNIFIQILTKCSPNKVSYKLSLKVNIKNVSYLHFSIGVLKLMCENKQIPLIERSSAWISVKHGAKITAFNNEFPDLDYKNDLLISSVIAWYGMSE